jgi:riboflavin synthase
MFTGIVTDIGEVLAVTPKSDNLHRIKIACSYERNSIMEGASIACSGICLTVVGAGEEDGRTWFAVDAAAETLALTNAGRWRRGTRVNLERALRYGDELGGHMISGHVDGLAELLAREDLTDSARFMLRVPKELSRFIAPKGSAALDGVSLTINDVEGDRFSVVVIPHTLRVTTFGAMQAGDNFNLEVDRMARNAARLIEETAITSAPPLRGKEAGARDPGGDKMMAEPRRQASGKKGDLKGARILVVEARFYDDIADALLAGATSALRQAGVSFDRIAVPGALEVPPAIAIALDAAARANKPYDGVVALGCVIRGDTIHFDIVAKESARGLMDLSIARRIPLGNGILTVDSEHQAWERARIEEADKGGDAARAALAMLRLQRSLIETSR